MADKVRGNGVAGRLTGFVPEWIVNRGGPGSGHFGHAGRPGNRGGSLPGEGDSGGKRYQMEGVNFRDVVSTAFRKSLAGYHIDAPFRLRQHDSASLFIAPDGEIYAAVGLMSHAELAQAVTDASVPLLPENLAKYYREAPITNAEAAYDLVFGRAGSVRSVWVKPGGAQTGELSISMDRSVGQTPEQERALADLFAEFPEREYSTHWSLWEKDNRVADGADRRSLMARLGMVERGGPGSGHFNHAGRPGERGGSAPSGEATTVEPLGVDRVPYGSRRPSVDWEAQDLQDRAKRVTETSIREDYASANPNVAVYQAWVPMEDVPSEVLAEEEDEDPEAYDWEQYSPRSSFPPVKLLVTSQGDVQILDGNHRIRYFRDSDMQYVPAWVLDYRMKQEQYEDLVERVGTATSGHHGHAGRPGQRGGSLPGDKQEEGGSKRETWDPAAHNNFRLTGGKANITVRSVMQAIYERTGWTPKGLNVANTTKAATETLYAKHDEAMRKILSRRLGASLRHTPMAVFTDSTDPNRMVVYVGGKAKQLPGGEDGFIYQQFLSHEFGHVMQRWYGFNLVGVIPNGDVPSHYADAVRSSYRTDAKIREEYLSDLFAVGIMGTYKLETSGMEVFPPRAFGRDEGGKLTVNVLASARVPFTDADRSTMNALLERLTDAAKGEPWPRTAPDANYANPLPPEPPAAFRAGPETLVHVFFDWGGGMGEILPVPISEVPTLPETAVILDMPDPRDEDEEPVERAGNAQSGHWGHKGRPGQRGGSAPGDAEGGGEGKAEGQTAREPKKGTGYTREQATTLKDAMRSKTHAIVYSDIYKDLRDIKKAWLAPDGTLLGIGVPPPEYKDNLTAYGGWHHGDQIVAAIAETGIPLLTVSEARAKQLGLGTARYWAAVRTANRLGFVRVTNSDLELGLMFEGQLTPEQKETVETLLYARAQARDAAGRTGGELLIDHVEPGLAYKTNATHFNEPETGDPSELPPAARALIGRSTAMRVTPQEYAAMLAGGIINRSAGLLRRMLTLADGPFIIGRGGPGSGHFGHEGRPGIRGGSLPSGVSGKYESEASAFKAVEGEGWTRNRQNIGANAPRYTSPRVQTGEQDGQPVWREQQVRLRFDGNTYYWETVDEQFGIGQTAADAFGISGTRIVEGEEETAPSPKAGSSIGPPKGYRYRPSRVGLPSMGGSGGMGGRGAWGAYHGGRAKQTDWKKHMAGDTMRSVIEESGGPTSGHWGHKGRPGERGGSQPGDAGGGGEAEGGGRRYKVDTAERTNPVPFEKIRARLENSTQKAPPPPTQEDVKGIAGWLGSHMEGDKPDGQGEYWIAPDGSLYDVHKVVGDRRPDGTAFAYSGHENVALAALRGWYGTRGYPFSTDIEALDWKPGVRGDGSEEGHVEVGGQGIVVEIAPQPKSGGGERWHVYGPLDESYRSTKEEAKETALIYAREGAASMATGFWEDASGVTSGAEGLLTAMGFVRMSRGLARESSQIGFSWDANLTPTDAQRAQMVEHARALVGEENPERRPEVVYETTNQTDDAPGAEGMFDDWPDRDFIRAIQGQYSSSAVQRTLPDYALAILIQRGGPTSGHWGHKGRPGERGGSQPGDGGAWPRYLKDSEGLHYPDYAFKGKAWQGGLRDAQAANSWGLKASGDAKDWIRHGPDLPESGWWTNEHDDQPPPEGEGWVKEVTESDGNTYYSNPELERLAGQPDEADGFIDDYVENTHGWYNRWLREGGKFGSDEAKADARSGIAAMDVLMDRSRIPEAVVAWRGMDDFGDRLRVGREFTDKGYTSTTLLSSIIGEKPYDDYGNGGRPFDWKFAIQVPRGTQGYYVGRDHGHGGGTAKEYELLIDRGTRFRVLSIDRENKTGVLKVIGQQRGRIP